MTSLPDAERDACEVVRALAALAALLSREAQLPPGDPTAEHLQRVMGSLAVDGQVAAARLLEYVQSLRGAGDGVAVAVPARLGPWREWVPTRGHLFGDLQARRLGELPQQRRTDPGE